ncbi:MAG: enoyl-CoA hydratase-related protein [Bryobacteraceae bacterium]|jgi:3-hydroxyacyl-CoA dehydrogenase
MSGLVVPSRRDEIGILTIDNAPVNALSTAVARELQAAIEALERDGEIRAIVLIGAGRTFIAGADIREFATLTVPPLNPVLNRIESCAKPVIAAIHGAALGGGLETAMACHYRVADAAAKLGQPEVKLGLIPGAGGTQRLPRLAGVETALRMCAFGEPVGAGTALASGVVDEIVESLLDGAVAFARRNLPLRPTRDRNDKLTFDASMFAAARAEVRARCPELIAPPAAIDAIEGAMKFGFEEGARREAELFERCLRSDQSQALIHVFFGEREVAKRFGAGVLESNAVLVERLSAAYRGGYAAEEGARILRDDTTLCPVDIDILAIHACGFPRWLGGPMWQAEHHHASST